MYVMSKDGVRIDADRTDYLTGMLAREWFKTALEAAWDDLPATAREQSGDDKEAFVKAETTQLSSPWFRFFLTYDPVPALEKVQCPVLAIFGEKDLQVDPKQNLPPMEKALVNNPDVTIREFEGLNHLFQTCETGALTEYAQIEETFAPVALDAIGDWIAERYVEKGK